MGKEVMLKLLGGFFALMLACTLLSRASASLTVAVVQTASPGKMALSHRVTGSGKVVADQQQAVSVEAGHEIYRVLVREGDRVEAGDVLLQLDQRALKEEWASRRGELENLELEIQDLQLSQRLQDEKRKRLLIRAQEDYDLAEAKCGQALSRAADQLNRAIDRFNAYYSIPAEEREGEESETMLEEEVDSAQKTYEEACTAQEEALLEAQRALEDAQVEEPPDSTLAQKENEAKVKRKHLRKLEKMLEEKGRVRAPVKATVTKVNVAAGEKTTEAPLLLLADLSAGCKFLAQVEREEEKHLEKNGPVIIKNESKKKTLEDLKIASVEVSQEDPSLLDVCVHLPADGLEIGDSAEMTVEKKSKTYDSCVPIQALHQEKGTYYVYVVEEKDSILGTQLTAMKMSVTVQEQNEIYAALEEGCLPSGQKVIRDSSKTIEEGSPVRLEEP